MSGDECFSVKRNSTVVGDGVNYLDGKIVKPAPLCFEVRGNIQPMNGKDLLLVPEGDRHKEQYWLYLPSNIITVENGLEVKDVTAMLLNDMVSRDCVNYQVQTVEDWGSYCRARLMRIDVGPDATP